MYFVLLASARLVHLNIVAAVIAVIVFVVEKVKRAMNVMLLLAE